MKRLVAVLAVVGLIAAANATVIYTQTVTGDAGGKMTIEVDWLGAFTATFGAKTKVDRYNIYFTGEGSTASTTWLAAVDFAVSGQLFQVWKNASYDSEFDVYNGTVSADGTDANLPSATLPTSGGSFRKFDTHFMQNADVRTDKTAPKENITSGAIYNDYVTGQYEGYGTFLGGVYGITTAVQTNRLLVAQLDLARNTTATFSSGTYSMQYSSYDQLFDEFGNPVLDEYGDPVYVNTLHTSTVTTAGQVSDASGEKFNVNGIVIQNTAPAPTGSNAKLWVGGTEPTGSGQGSTLTQNFNRVMQGTATSTSVTLNKSGTDSNTTNASVTLTGDAMYSGTVTTPQTLSNFGTVSTVNVGIKTTTLGDRTGTVTLDNQATNSAGTSQGSDNGNAVITVNATVLANRTFNGGTASFGNVLKGATLSQIVSVTSTGAHNMYTNTTIAATSNTTNGLIAEGAATVFDGTTTSGNWTVHGTTTTYGALTGSNLTLLHTQGEVGVSGTQAPNDAQIPLTGNVGLATAAVSGTSNLSSFVSGNALYAAVANAGHYDGLASKTTAGGNVVGTEAIILDGDNTSGVLQNVAMNWRDRATVEMAGGTSPPLYRADLPLASDVVKVSGMAIAGGRTDGTRVETTTYVLQMSYNESLLGHSEAWMMGPEGPGICLMWLDEDYDGVAGASANDRWQSAVSGNFGAGVSYSNYYQRAYNPATDFVLGRYGVDTTNNVVWAVVNFNGQFAVPEPATMGLLAIGGLMVLVRKRRR